MCVEISKNNPVDYLILAGDIVNYTKREYLFRIFINSVIPYYKNIFYVLGNHEYYGAPMHDEHFLSNHRNTINKYNEMCEDLGIILLENDHIELDKDVVVYGTTLWSKFSKKASIMLADRWHITKKGIKEMHEEAKQKLDEFISDYKNKKIIIITHHLPSFSLTDPMYHEDDPENGVNSGFASNCEHMIKNPVKYWIYGHTHTGGETTINGVKMLCNPHGYPHENKEFRDIFFEI